MFVLLLSRCPAGDNWWYMGKRCERKGSTQENTIIAVSSTISVFVVMLIVTITTAVCLKKKYSQGEENGESRTLEEVSILPFSTMIYIYLLKINKSSKIKLEDITFLNSEDSSVGIKELR